MFSDHPDRYQLFREPVDYLREIDKHSMSFSRLASGDKFRITTGCEPGNFPMTSLVTRDMRVTTSIVLFVLVSVSDAGC